MHARSEYTPIYVDPDGALAELYSQPDLPCRGRPGTFDIDLGLDEEPEARIARLRTAVGVCRSCPAIALCDRAWRELPPRHTRGVWAGRVLGVGDRISRAVLTEPAPAEAVPGA